MASWGVEGLLPNSIVTAKLTGLCQEAGQCLPVGEKEARSVQSLKATLRESASVRWASLELCGKH